MPSNPWLRIAVAATLAASASITTADENAVRTTLQHIFPEQNVQSLQPSPVAGVFEAVIDGRAYYVSADGRYVLGGPLVDVQNRVNLSEARLEKINAIPWDSLPLELAVKRTKGAGTRRVAIFEDPDCPYCKELEQTLREVDDITVYVLLFPIDELHPQAAEKSRAVWCATDRAKAWDEVMRTGVAPPAPPCQDPLATIGEFARRHRISGTPTLILADGRRLVGAVPRERLEAELRRTGRR
jgi:thiol:disulfide interchange protein DsbC